MKTTLLCTYDDSFTISAPHCKGTDPRLTVFLRTERRRALKQADSLCTPAVVTWLRHPYSKSPLLVCVLARALLFPSKSQSHMRWVCGDSAGVPPALQTGLRVSFQRSAVVPRHKFNEGSFSASDFEVRSCLRSKRRFVFVFICKAFSVAPTFA